MQFILCVSIFSNQLRVQRYVNFTSDSPHSAYKSVYVPYGLLFSLTMA